MKKLFLIATMLFVSMLATAAITFTPTAIDTGYNESTYSCKVTAAGGTAPYVYTISVGTLPSGLKINRSTGLISGTIHLTADTSISFTVRAVDAASTSGTKAYVMYIRNQRMSWNSTIDAWDNIPNTPPTYKQVYNTYRTSANNIVYSYGYSSLILPFDKKMSSLAGKATFHLGAVGSQYYYLNTLGGKGASNVTGDSTKVTMKYTTLTSKSSSVLVDSSKAVIYAHDSIRIGSSKIKFPSLPTDTTGLTSGMIYKASGNEIRIKY